MGYITQRDRDCQLRQQVIMHDTFWSGVRHAMTAALHNNTAQRIRTYLGVDL